MNPILVQEQILGYLSGTGRLEISGVPIKILWQNMEDPPKGDRVEINFIGSVTDQLNFDSSSSIISVLVLTVVTQVGDYIKVRNEMLKEVYNKFPAHLEIGEIVIKKLPEIKSGFYDKEEFRTPIYIEYTAIIE